MSTCSTAGRAGLVLVVLAGCVTDKTPAANFEDCFDEDGAGLPSGWDFDATHWACDSSPIGKAFEINTSSFPSGLSSASTAFDNAAVPWNASSAVLTITPGTGSLTSSIKDEHNAVYYLDDHHPSQIGWLAATLCNPKTGSDVEANDCDTRIFSKFLDVRDDPATTGTNEEATTAISWSTSNTSGTTGSYRLPAVFAHEIAHVVGFGHNNGIGSLSEESVGKDEIVPSTLDTDDENALQWVYGT